MKHNIKRWNDLAEIKKELAERDWFPATSGNLAIKISDNPLQFYVTASGKDKRKATLEDFVLVDRFGKPVEGESEKPSAETLLHVEIFTRTNAECSLHIHTVDNNVISEIYGDDGVVTFRGQEIIKAFGLWEENAEISVPIIRNDAHIPTLAENFSKHVHGDFGAVLIRNHGITVWGETPVQTKKYLEAFEFLFSYHLKLKQFQSLKQTI